MSNTESKFTALYERLSSDDGTSDESNSIQNQKILLEQYAHENGFTNIRHYTDDGISGLRFDDRPSYVRMMEDIENGLVSTCLIKDMSRLGRDHIRVGLAMETMRINEVRLIAVVDGVDTSKGDDDFTPFRNIMHEFYAKDCSKKVKSAYRAKGMSGKPIASLPIYGYKKHPDNKDVWIVDEEAAAVVRRIFNMVMEGHGLYHICYTLTQEKILAPAAYLTSKGTGKWLNRSLPDPHTWNLTTVDRLLKKREYCGDIVNFKTSKHYKDKRSKSNDEKDWVVFEDVHEAIIDRVTFENVQRIYKSTKKVRAEKGGKHHPLAGLLFCSACGNKMYIFRESKKGKKAGKSYAQCGKYRGSYDKIAHHYNPLCPVSCRITVESLLEVVRATIKVVADYAKSDKDGFEKMLRELLAKEQTVEIKAKRKRLIFCEKRHIELNTLLNKIYEDNALGRLDEERYKSLSQTYGQEQKELVQEIAKLREDVEMFEDGNIRSRRFAELVNRYTDFTELTPSMLHEFIEKIVVHERVDRYSHTPQQVDIHFNFIGEFVSPHPEPEPTEEELAAQKKREREREYNRRKYQKRKDAGTHLVYYERQKARKQAEKLNNNHNANGENKEGSK